MTICRFVAGLSAVEWAVATSGGSGAWHDSPQFSVRLDREDDVSVNVRLYDRENGVLAALFSANGARVRPEVRSKSVRSCGGGIFHIVRVHE